MLTYDLKVGYSCNNKCKHCVIEDSKDKLIEHKVSVDLKTEECLEQVEYAFEKGAKFIVLTGGEVTIRKDFPLLISACAKRNFNITIQTNGRRLANDIISNAICSYDKIRCVVALHGSKATTHDKITQVKGSFNETCNGIKHLCQKNKLVVLKIVISKLNMNELVEIVKLAAELGVKYACFAFPHGQGAARKNFSTIIPPYTDLKPILKDLISVAKQNKINIEFEAIPFCIIPYAMQLVGEIKYLSGNTLCTQVKENTFDWSEVRKNIKRKSSKCNCCDMNGVCEGIWYEYAEAFGLDELIPIELPKQYKKLIINKLKSYD